VNTPAPAVGVHYLCYGQDQQRCSWCLLLTYGGSEEKREVVTRLPVSRMATYDCSQQVRQEHFWNIVEPEGRK
jgi:hypothetical protein